MATAENENRANLSEKIVFFNKLGLLMKATSADNEPTSGYLLDEISGLSWQSGSLCSDLLDYLCARMDEKNYFVKRKTLLIMKFLVQKGHPDFRENLRKNSHIIGEATSYSSPPDPLLGTKPHTDVREIATELLELMFEEEGGGREEGGRGGGGGGGAGEPCASPEPNKPSLNISGMGSSTGGSGRMQGFGNTVPRPNNKGLGGIIIEGLRDLAEKINEEPDVVRHLHSAEYGIGSYQPVVMETERQKLLAMQTMAQQPREREREHRPGVAGGGWEDQDLVKPGPVDPNDPSSLKSSNESTELAERLASVSVNDWSQEQQIMDDFVQNQTAPIPKRAEIDAFIERCGCVNCDKLTELLNENLNSDNDVVIVRSLVFLEYMLRCDVISPDNLAWTCHQNLTIIFTQGSPQPQLKARKMILQLERLSSNSYLFMDNLPTSHIQLAPSVGGS